MNRPRIAIVTPGSFPVPSPGSSSVEHVVTEMARLLQRTTDVEVFGRRFARLPRKERIEGVTYIRVAPHKRSGYAARIVKQLRGKSYRVIQVENRPRIAYILKKKLPGAVVWLSLHSLTYVSPGRTGAEQLSQWLSAPDRIVVNSHFLKEELVKLYPHLVQKLLVNHLGVSPEQFRSRWDDEGDKQRQEQLIKLKLLDRKIILYVGRLIPLKGVHYLLEAMPEVVSRVPNAQLILVGGAFYGSKRETGYVRRLKRLAKQASGHILFVPFVPHNRIQEWYRIADVAVVPTPRREAFGLVNVEAMATGIPVVACAAGGIVEVVEHGETGFLVPPEGLKTELSDYIVAVLTDNQLQAELGYGCLQRVRQYFAWEHVVSRWLQLLEEHTM